ncbi:T9SS sorting signal type C domain-containing protein [Flavobacterium sp. M31R6]|uniref:Ig-like domain-containing protein n=1 Tax=Flavobacterium sp. M31R6 TaxID=2739062 RepID=UPI00156A6EE2|nr:T9SS sorting signal type C domain-containing protein [Flavobacterium sp. M31R6]QKJ62831.1 T9SS sorting signal type C domain-containing protein [Flavobacterium sp. M31R6]
MKKFYLNLEQYVSKTVILFWPVLILFTFGNSVFAQTTVNLTTPGSATWTVPCGVTSLTVEAWGGGGAGGAATIIPSGGSGGGGGGYSTYIVAVTPGQIINYTVGQGGVGGSGNGGDGSSTTILALTANGGIGGFQDNGTAGLGGTASGGTTNTSGGNGTIGSATAGEAGGNSANGGNGGLAVTIESNGDNGTAPGGGGGGGLLLAGAGPSNGGNGGSGQITITYNTPAALTAPSPVTPSSGISICFGKSTNLNATSSGNTINWYTVPTGGTSIGSSASGINFPVSPAGDTTYYAEAESSPGCVSTTRTATGLITVTALPVITAQPVAPAAVCTGSGTRTIGVTATGTSLTYQWRKNGTNLTNTAPYSNVTTASMSITNPAISENGASFDVVITDAQGCFVTSNAVALTVNALPAITTQPATPTATCAGTGTKNISVTATGATSYQWRKNGTNLTNGAPYTNVTTATMTITNPAFSENGASFDVVITNAQGCTITSNAVVLTVNPSATAATLVTPNTPTNICNGTSINLNATSTGNTIYWFTVPTGGGNVGSSASAVNFLIAPPSSATTTYYADARTAAGCFSTARTATGTVTASAPPTISVQPASPAAICAGTGTRSISITSTATSWQWRLNGVDLTNNATFSGVNTATLTITNPAITDGGTYTVMLNGSTCGLVSNNATLTVNASPSPPTGVTPNSPVVVCTSDGKTPLTATVSAGNTIDWYTVASGGSSLGSSTSGANFLVSAPTATVYYAEAHNSNGCVSPTRTATASVTSNVLPAITTQPATPAAACAGTGTVTITIGATGVTTYQWRKNGTPLSNVAPYSGVTTATLTITNPPIGDNGATFDVVLNSATCPVTSNAVTLTVNTTPTAPTAVTPNATVTICGSGNINLNATSAGNTIYWYTVATLGSTIGNSNSGVNLSITPPGGTTTYYAEARTPAGCSSLTRTATAAITVTPTPVVTVEFTEQVNDKTYSIAACGHIAAAENDIDVHSGNPAGVNATTFGPTATGQWQVSYDNQATWVNAPGPTSTTPQYLFDPAYTIFESTPGTYYFRLILTVNGCPGTSDVITLTVNGNPTLTPGSIATDQSSCTAPFNPAAFTQTAAPTVATPISGYNFSYIWQSSTDNVTFTNIAGATAATYDSPNINVTTYFRRYAIYGSAGGGCSAVSNTITVLVGSLPAPTVGTITQPTCGVATGSVVLSGLPTPGTYTITRTGTSGATYPSLSGATTTITGLAAGTYNFTVTQAGCASPSAASANVVINAQPVTPAAPTASVTAQPTCPTPKGTIVVTVPAPAANVTYTLTGTSPAVAAVTQAGATFANLSPGIYSLTTTNTTSGCTSTAISLTINAVPAIPPTPTASVTVQPSCSLATGTIVVSAPAPNPNLTYTVTGTSPVVAAVTQGTATFANLSPGTYSVTINNTVTVCTSNAVSLTVNAQPAIPTAPIVGTITQPTCALATGSVALSGLPASGTWTINPGGTTGTGTTTTLSGLTAGTTYNFTVTNAAGCISPTSANVVINAQPIPPAIPTLSSTATSCSADGTSTISNYSAGNTYTFTPAGPSAGAGGAISGMTFGTSYTVTATSGGCTSAASASFSNAAQLPTPAVPTLSSTAASCSANGTSTISNYNAGNTYTFTPAGPSAGAGGAISSMTLGTSYTVTASSGGCTSVASASFSNAAQLPTPAVPTLSSTVASCSADGTSTISNYNAGNTYTFTPAGPSAGAGGAISGMTLGTSYTVTASSGGCTSAASASFSNAAQLPTPAVPTLSSTATSCSADGTSTISNYNAGNTYAFTPAGPSAGAGGAISGMTLGTSYTVTASSGGCTSAASASFSNAAQLPTPAVPTLTSTAASCSADGTSTISNYNAGNTYTFTPAGPSAGAGGAISSMTLGTSYTVTASSGGCTSVASASFSNAAQLPTPAVPTLSSTVASCSADGTSTISNYNAGNTYTFTPAGPSAGAGGAISGMTLGTSYTVTASSGGCTSAASSSFSNVAQLPTPAVPTLSNTAASCSADGTSTISNYNAGNTYTFTPAGPSAGAGGAISGMTLGTSYTVTASNGGCTSVASASFSNAAQLPTPAVPTLSTTAASCSADGTSTISNYNAGNTYTFTPAGPSAGAGGAISGMTLGTSYTVTASSGGCTSVASASFSNAAQLPTPAVPTLTAGTVNCNDVTANWTTIPNVTGYRIDVARDNIFTDIIPAYNNLLLGSGVVTENVTGLASGLTFYIRVRAENSCGTSANSTTLTITTGASPTAFTTALVQPNCVTATGQITINESVVDPSDQYSFDDGATYQSSNVKDLLAAGTYNVRVKNTNGCETLATTVVLNAAAVTTYSGSWSNGVPDVLKKAIFASNYTFSGDIQACSCEVDTGVTVTVNPGFSLVLENGIDVLGSGSLIFENNSSLIQTNNVVNTGNITYKRNTTPVGKFDYTYWSSPVYPQTLLNVSPTTLFDKYLSWDAVGGKWKVEATGTVMEKGTGYIIRGPQANATPAVHTASFIGVPNNGTISVSIAGSGLSYLLGNPYPSALDADEFLGANPALDGTIRFWTHNTPVTNLKYNGNDYASYNAVGGTGTAAANTGVNNSIPTGKIAAGQAFFATSNAAGTVTFENTMRVGPGGTILNNSQFFKGPKPKTSSALKKHRVWLNLSNTDGAFKQLLLGYVTNATNGLDRLFDGQTLNANKYVDFYSINESKKLSIQGRALPFDVMDQVPLGFKTTIEGTFSINIEQTDGVLASLPIFLEDKLTGTIVNLKNGDYSFSTAIGTFDDRFVLRYIDSSIKISDYANILDEINKKVLVSVKNHHIKINSFDQTIENVTIYDLSRRKLYEKDNINSNEFNVPDFSSTNQFLMVQIRLKNGKIVTDKIIY